MLNHSRKLTFSSRIVLGTVLKFKASDFKLRKNNVRIQLDCVLLLPIKLQSLSRIAKGFKLNRAGLNVHGENVKTHVTTQSKRNSN